jgi:hypothetical protein
MGAFRLNEDAMSMAPSMATVGPKVGFLRAFELAYDDTVRSQSWLGAQVALREREEQNFKRIRELGETPPPTLNRIDDRLTSVGIYDRSEYWQYMKAMADADTYSSLDSEEDRTRAQFRDKANRQVLERNARLKELKAKYPDAGIETYEEMFGGVVNEAETARRRWATSRTTVGGMIGGFTGSVIGSVNPETDPLNFYTLGVGGVGRTLVGRLATEAGAQGVIESVNQVTGTQDTQRVLGMDPTTQDALWAIGGAALGGAVIRGAGEGIGYGFRKWFASTPNDPAPPLPTPLPPETPVRAPEQVTMSGLEAVIGRIKRENPSRAGRAAAVADLADAARQLNSWSATAANLTPTMSTRIPTSSELPLPELPGAFAEAARTRTADELARLVDPDTFRVYDRLADRVQAIRGILAQRDRNVSAAAAGVDERIAALETRIASSKRNQPKLQRELDELKATRTRAFDENAGREKSLREELARADEKMRDLAPVVSRAYARARNQWTLDGEQRAQIDAMVQRGEKQLGENALLDRVERGEEPRPPTLEERAPVVMTIVDKRAGEPAIDAVLRKMPEDEKLLDANVDQFIRLAAKYGDADTIKAAQEKGEEIAITVEGHDYAVPLTEKLVTGFDEDGKPIVSTLKDMFDEMNEDQAALKALGSCSTVKPS